LPKTEIAGEYGQINSYSKDNSLGVSQSFAFPTVYTNRRRLARANVKSSEWNKRAAMADVAADVRRVYNQIVFLNEHLSLLSYQDSLYARFAATAEVRYKSGDARKLEYMTARTQQSESANRVMETKRDIKIYVGRLQALLNSPEPVLPSVNKLLAMPYRSVPIDEVMTGNPTMRLMRQEVENAKIAQQLEGSRMLPDFRVGISSQTIRGTQDVDGAQRTFGSGNRFNSIQLGVSVPLFYSSSKAKVKAARMQAAKAQTDADNYAKGICRGYLSLMEELQKQRGIIDYYERQAVPEADMIISQSDYSYRQGEIAYSEYIVNVTKALDIKQNYIDAINNYNQTVISLQSAEGE
jgi:cobalt-zinc-cadmium resistance protein CzcA